MATLKFYNESLSQPVRAVWMFLKINNIPFEDIKISAFKGEHKTEEYLKKFPQGKVPGMEDNGFILTESVAILQYVCAQYSDYIAPHWYPRDIKQRAMVNEYLNWQHNNLRKNGVAYFVSKILMPILRKEPADDKKVAEASEELSKTLDFIETNFLKNTKYVAGDNITLADLLCIAEIMQPIAGGYDVVKGRPNLAAYIERVKTRLGPVFDEAHKAVFELTKGK